MILFFLTGVVEALAFGHLAAFTPMHLRALGVPESAVAPWTGFLAAVGFVVGIPLLPFWGAWAERWGRKLIIVRSAYVQAVMFGLLAASGDVYRFAAARALSGLSLGNTGVMLALQAEITPPERRTTAVALITAGPPVGMAVGPLLGGFVVDALGVRPLLWLDAALTALMGLVLTAVLREPARDGGAHEARAPVTRLAWAALRDTLAAPGVGRLFGVYFLATLATYTVAPFLPLRIEALHAGPRLAQTIGAVLTAAGVTMALSTPLWGRIGDARGPLPGLRSATVGLAVSLAGQAVAADLRALAGWRLVQGAFQGGVVALSLAAVAAYAPADRRAAILSLSLLPQQLSWFLGPLLGGWLARAGITAVFAAGALLAGAAALLALRVAGQAGTARAPAAH